MCWEESAGPGATILSEESELSEVSYLKRRVPGGGAALKHRTSAKRADARGGQADVGWVGVSGARNQGKSSPTQGAQGWAGEKAEGGAEALRINEKGCCGKRGGAWGHAGHGGCAAAETLTPEKKPLPLRGVQWRGSVLSEESEVSVSDGGRRRGGSGVNAPYHGRKSDAGRGARGRNHPKTKQGHVE